MLKYLSTRPVRLQKMFWPYLLKYATRLGHTLLPAHCLICKQPTNDHNGLCTPCDAEYFGVKKNRCTCCALPLDCVDYYPKEWLSNQSLSLCGACIAHPPSFDATLALADYTLTLDQLALGLKFHARLAVASEWARRLAQAVRTTWSPTDWPELIAPVPLFTKRLSQRGYNQAWEIARPLARALGIPAHNLLTRIRDTPPQLQLNAHKRRRNLSNAFKLTRLSPRMPSLMGRHIAIVDDVMTSGATLECIAQLLKKAGVERVTNFVALRTQRVI